MSFAKQAQELVAAGATPGKKDKGPGMHPFTSSVYKTLGTAAAGALAGAGLLVGHKILQAAKRGGNFEAMTGHAGEAYTELDPKQKAQARRYFDALARHSPTSAQDPQAAWNHVSHFLKHESSYGPGTIEQLHRVESAKPSFFRR